MHIFTCNTGWKVREVHYVHHWIQSLSHLRLFAALWTETCQASLFFTIFLEWFKLMSIESVTPFNNLFLPSISPRIWVFLWVSSLHRQKYWSFSFNISPSSEYSGLVSSRIDWFDLLADQGALKSPPRHHNSKASVLQFSAFFMVQLAHPYMTSGKTIALNRQTIIGKVISLLFNMLSRIVIAFLPRNNRLLTLWLQSLSSVVLRPKKIKSITVYIFSSSICLEVMGPDAMILVLWILSFKPAFFLYIHTKC